MVGEWLGGYRRENNRQTAQDFIDDESNGLTKPVQASIPAASADAHPQGPFVYSLFSAELAGTVRG